MRVAAATARGYTRFVPSLLPGARCYSGPARRCRHSTCSYSPCALPDAPQTLPVAPRRSQTLSDAPRRSQTLPVALRRSQTLSDAPRRSQTLTVCLAKSTKVRRRISRTRMQKVHSYVLTASQKSSSFSNTYANECLRCVGRRLVEVRYFASGAAKHEFAIKMKDLRVGSVLENGARPSY